jgi:nitroreductase
MVAIKAHFRAPHREGRANHPISMDTDMNTAHTDHPVHALIAARWSPSSFDERPIPTEHLAALFEAARWAPSSFNEQPWRYIVATKDQPEEFATMLSVLVPKNQAWAASAPALAISFAKRTFSQNGAVNRSAVHDVGQATANLTAEATARGLYVHQMAGILTDRIRESYQVPEEFEVVAGMAIGYLGTGALPKTRSRKPLTDFVYAGSWGVPADLPGKAQGLGARF